MTRYAYLHGFGSGPRSNKGVQLAAIAQERGLPEVVLPDLNAPSFERLSTRAMLGAVDAMDDAHGRASAGERWCLVGSSLGGWLAARWAELHPARVERLVLLCPGFALGERWPDVFGGEKMEAWARDGVLPLPNARGELVSVHYAFYAESRADVQWPEVPCPTVIVHGRDDGVVPIELSRRYVATRPQVTLVEVDDDHSLARSIGPIARAVWGDAAGVQPPS